MSPYRQYATELVAALQGLPFGEIERAVAVLHHARVHDRHVFVMGNGGSASTASHMACDLGKGAHVEGQPRLRVICLNDNVPLLSAYANDTGYENAFASHLEHFVQVDDVVVAISTSGMSPNVIHGVDLARRHGARAIGLTGADGGALLDRVDVCVRVPTTDVERTEDIHLVLSHMMTMGLRLLSQGAPPAAKAAETSR